MKKSIAALLALWVLSLTSPLALKADDESYLYLVYTEAVPETELNVGALTTLGKLTFTINAEEQLLNVHANDGSVQSFDLNTVSRLYFSNYADAIREEQMPVEEVALRVQGGWLYTGGLEAGLPVSIYKVDGSLVKCLETTGAPLSVSELSSGLYIVKAGGVTSKIVK